MRAVRCSLRHEGATKERVVGSRRQAAETGRSGWIRATDCAGRKPFINRVTSEQDFEGRHIPRTIIQKWQKITTYIMSSTQDAARLNSG
ncbi:hypothetical protein KCP69_24910 [Salmonella enterica subsp. enterica]|nr:hypothetical protein KCP69_24910 [Salmonella enterica subsp. enterica]